MRRFLTSIVAVAATLVPVLALAENPNQQMAEQIGAHMRQSGQLSQYKIAVKFKDGTAWLQGQVRDAQQAKTAMTLALEPDGVDRVVNNLTITPVETPAVVKQASVTETVPDAKPADEEAAEPVEKPQQKEDVTRASSPPPKPVLAFLDGFRRPSATQSRTQPAEDPADAQSGAQRVPVSFASAPVHHVVATEPDVIEPASQPMAEPGTAGPRPISVATLQPGAGPHAGVPGGPLPMCVPGVGGAAAPTRFDVPNMPNHAWPSYASYPNYAAVTYPRQYSATAWPYIGPFYPYPQVPLGWRKVTLQWDDGWWMLDFKDEPSCCWWR